MTYDEIVARHPQLFPSRFYFQCDEGWLNIIDMLCRAIQHHVDGLLQKDASSPVPQILQVKEKFGTLRFYVSWSDDWIRGAIEVAELISARTCEVCGVPGTRRTGPWIRVLCDVHDAERREDK